jgi:hypothetical protein
MKKLAYFLLLAPLSASAAECLLAERSQVQAVGRVDQIQDLKVTVIALRDQSRRCTVNFRAKINGVWSPGFGEYTWRTDMPDEIACNNALERAKTNLIELTGNQRITSEKHLQCDEGSDPIKTIRVGQTVAENSWTPHPKKVGSFWYQGAECRWFVETDVMGRDLYQWQGIVCRVRQGEWVVVDKF